MNHAQLSTGEDANIGHWHLCQHELVLLDSSVLIKRQDGNKVSVLFSIREAGAGWDKPK